MVKDTIKYRGIELVVTYEIIKPYRGMRDSLGVPMEPDEVGDVDLERVEHRGEDITDLLDGQFRAIEKVIMEGGE